MKQGIIEFVRIRLVVEKKKPLFYVIYEEKLWKNVYYNS